MPRYFFHIRDSDGFIQDDEGMIFADDFAAKREGQISAAEMLAHDLRFKVKMAYQAIEVTDEVGAVLATYPVDGSAA